MDCIHGQTTEAWISVLLSKLVCGNRRSLFAGGDREREGLLKMTKLGPEAHVSSTHAQAQTTTHTAKEHLDSSYTCQWRKRMLLCLYFLFGGIFLHLPSFYHINREKQNKRQNKEKNAIPSSTLDSCMKTYVTGWFSDNGYVTNYTRIEIFCVHPRVHTMDVM